MNDMNKSYKQTKQDFFKEKIKERTSQGKGFSYSRINQEWSKSDERINKMFENVPTDKRTPFESNFLDVDDV